MNEAGVPEADGIISRLLQRGPFLLLLIGLALSVNLALSSFEGYHLQKGPLLDDSFYALNVSRNLAHLGEWRHDSFSPTSGVQPLFVVLVMPVFWVSSDPITAVHLVLLLQSGIWLAAGGLLLRMGRSLGGLPAAWLLAGAWVFSPHIRNNMMNGLETGLVVLVNLVLWHYARGLTVCTEGEGGAKGRRAAQRRWMIFGLLAGLAYLARVDAAIWVAVLLFDRWVRHRKIRGPLIAGASGLILVLPWSIWCWWVAGTPLPESGQAVRLLARIYADSAFFNPHDFSTPFFWLHNLLLIAYQTLRLPYVAPMGLGAGGLWWSRDLSLFPRSDMWVPVAIGVAAFAGLLGVWMAKRLTRSKQAGDLKVVWTYTPLVVAAYAIWVPAQWFYPRYLFFASVLLLFAWSVMVGQLVSSLRPRSIVAVVLAGITMMGLGFYVEQTRQDRFLSGYRIGKYYQLHRLLENEPRPPGAPPVGVLQSGVVGYFGSRPFVALDGKVNRTVFRALEEGRLGKFLDAQGIDRVVDVEPWWLDAIFRLRVGSTRPPFVRRVRPGLVEYRRSPPARVPGPK